MSALSVWHSSAIRRVRCLLFIACAVGLFLSSGIAEGAKRCNDARMMLEHENFPLKFKKGKGFVVGENMFIGGMGCICVKPYEAKKTVLKAYYCEGNRRIAEPRRVGTQTIRKKACFGFVTKSVFGGRGYAWTLWGSKGGFEVLSRKFRGGGCGGKGLHMNKLPKKKRQPLPWEKR